MEHVASIPASVLDERAAKLFRIAADAVKLALATAPNWRDSRYVTEDLQRASSISRDLELLATAEVRA